MTFTLNQPFATSSPTVDVDPGLAPGVYRYELVVINDRGQRSNPARVDVQIVDSRGGGSVRDPPGPIGPIGPVRDVVVPPIPPVDPRRIVTPVPIPTPGRTPPNP
jgi:hypothetical protein